MLGATERVRALPRLDQECQRLQMHLPFFLRIEKPILQENFLLKLHARGEWLRAILQRIARSLLDLLQRKERPAGSLDTHPKRHPRGKLTCHHVWK